jgi:5,10-methylenetetrahydromethanopterin reductase
MKVGFFFWPYSVELCEQMAHHADEYGYDQIGIADTPGNAMDPWVAAALVARLNKTSEVSICVTNFVTRQPAVNAAAIASLELLAPGRTILGIGAGHSGTKNLGAGRSTARQMADGITVVRTLLRGQEVKVGEGGAAQMPWVKKPSRVFMASSHPLGLEAAGRVADGVFINYGLQPENVRESEAVVEKGIAAANRSRGDLDIWQIGAMDCTDDGDHAREKIGAMLAFIAGYIVSDKDPITRGVPQRHRDAMLELRRRYSTRPGAQNIQLVKELGLFDYLSKRVAVCGTPDECCEQMIAAKNAGIDRIMFSVSVAVDPAEAVRRFGKKVLPMVRASA